MHVSLLNTWPSINRNIFFVRGKSSYIEKLKKIYNKI